MVPKGRYAEVEFDCPERWFPECRLELVGQILSDYTARGGTFEWCKAEARSDRVPVAAVDELHDRLLWAWSKPCGGEAAA